MRICRAAATLLITVFLGLPMDVDAGDAGSRDLLVLSESGLSGDEVEVQVNVVNDERIVALDIPLRFGQPGESIELVRVDFAARVATWDVTHAQIDNAQKTVILGLISSLAGDWESTGLQTATIAGSGSTIATLVFKVPSRKPPSITTFETDDPGHSLTYILSTKQAGKHLVEEIKPELSATVSYKLSGVPLTFGLSEAFPNPFNPSTSFTLTVPEEVDYSLRIYNVTGQLVKSLGGHIGPGVHQLKWNGLNSQGSSVASGIYLVTVRAGTLHETRRMLLLR